MYTVAFHPDGSLAASGGIDAIGEPLPQWASACLRFQQASERRFSYSDACPCFRVPVPAFQPCCRGRNQTPVGDLRRGSSVMLLLELLLECAPFRMRF